MVMLSEKSWQKILSEIKISYKLRMTVSFRKGVVTPAKFIS